MMKKKTSDTFKRGLVLSLALLAPLALAQNKGQPDLTPEHFAHLDKDKSGSVSEAEYREFMEASFTQLDADKKGSLSAPETAQTLTVEQFVVVDKDKNGELSRQEFMDVVMSDFHRYDRNKDAQLQP